MKARTESARAAAARTADDPGGDRSAVERLSHEEERRHLEGMLSDPPGTVLAASDLHLAEGRDPETGAYDARENFFAAGAFRRWLDHHAGEAAEGALLILVGDVFDFLRVMSVPSDDADYARWSGRLRALGEEQTARSLPRAIPKVERTFGLRTHDFRTVWKLLVIRLGHPEFFEALAGWVAAGGRLVIAAGNHDPELYWPLVRQAIRDQLVRDGAPASGARDRVAFSHEPFTVENLHVEHGHRFEAMTRIDDPPVLESAPSQLRLPLGSFVNRYFINHIERLDPFIDNIKPVQDALTELLRRRPLRVLSLYLRAARFIRRALAIPRAFSRAYALIAFASLGLPLITLGVLIAALLAPGFRDWLVDVVANPWARAFGAAGGALFPVLLPYAVGGGKEVLRTLGIIGKEDPLRVGAEEALREAFGDADRGEEGPDGRPDRIYAVMGHTHRQTAVRLEGFPSAEAFYVNTGTWIPLWPKNREDLTGEVFYSYQRFDRSSGGGYVHSALEWDDAAGAARPARILKER